MAMTVAACGDDDEADEGAATSAAAPASSAAPATSAAEPATSEAAPATSEAAPESSEAPPESEASSAEEPASSSAPAETAIVADTAPKVALFAPIKNSYVEAVIQSATATAEGLGGSVEVFVADFDAAKQQSQIQNAITSEKFNAFIVYPVDSAGVVPVVEEAIGEGIPVAAETVVIGPDSKTDAIQVDGLTSSAANPPYLDGQSGAEATIKACADRDPCKVVFLAGDFAFGYDTGFQAGLKDGLASQPQIEVVAEPQGKYQADPAYTAMRPVLQANPDANVVVSTSDVMIGGAVRAVEDAGMTAGADGVALIGNGGSEIGYKGVQDGTWFGTIVWLPEQSARLNVENLTRALNDQPIDQPAVYTTRLSPIGVVLDASNVADFTPQWAGS
jgi:ribose transport system substrate-binding protein